MRRIAFLRDVLTGKLSINDVLRIGDPLQIGSLFGWVGIVAGDEPHRGHAILDPEDGDVDLPDEPLRVSAPVFPIRSIWWRLSGAFIFSPRIADHVPSSSPF